jgi:hypothetical protein
MLFKPKIASRAAKRQINRTIPNLLGFGMANLKKRQSRRRSENNVRDGLEVITGWEEFR